MKKLIFTIMIMLLTATGVSAAEPELNILPSCGAENGQVEVTITISESDVVCGSFAVGYDKTLLSPVSVTVGTAIGSRGNGTNLDFDRDGVKGIKLGFMAIIDKDTGESIPLDSGNLCTIVFDVLTADKTISDVFIADAALIDDNANTLTYTATSGKVYLNQFVCNALFTKDGIETNKLYNSGMALTAGVFNGTNKNMVLRAYAAQYSESGALLSVESIPYTLTSGSNSSETLGLDIDGEAHSIKVMFWDDNDSPLSEIFYIEK